MAFQKATKKQARLRLALIGPSGSGKTYSALAIASGLAPGGRVAVIDTERASASKYADAFSFDACELETFHPQRYIDAIVEAERAGYDVLVIDSLSHAWMGKEGALEQVDRVAARNKAGNSFGAWREVTPMHHALVDAILRSRCHVIATMRVKTEWVLERDEKTGRTAPRKVGLAPVQRDGVEYEFDVVGDLDAASLVITKTRCKALHQAVIREPGAPLGATLRQWLTDGAPAAVPTPLETPAVQAPSSAATASTAAPAPATTSATPSPLDLVAIALDECQTAADVDRLLPRIRGLQKSDQDQLRARYKAARDRVSAAPSAPSAPSGGAAHGR
jgi:AAA domain-containing protein